MAPVIVPIRPPVGAGSLPSSVPGMAPPLTPTASSPPIGGRSPALYPPAPGPVGPPGSTDSPFRPWFTPLPQDTPEQLIDSAREALRDPAPRFAPDGSTAPSDPRYGIPPSQLSPGFDPATYGPQDSRQPNRRPAPTHPPYLPPYLGGQLPVQYFVTVAYTYDNPTPQTYTTTVFGMGPILGLEAVSAPNNAIAYRVAFSDGTKPVVEISQSLNPSAGIQDVRRVDGSPVVGPTEAFRPSPVIVPPPAPPVPTSPPYNDPKPFPRRDPPPAPVPTSPPAPVPTSPPAPAPEPKTPPGEDPDKEKKVPAPLPGTTPAPSVPSPSPGTNPGVAPGTTPAPKTPFSPEPFGPPSTPGQPLTPTPPPLTPATPERPTTRPIPGQIPPAPLFNPFPATTPGPTEEPQTTPAIPPLLPPGPTVVPGESSPPPDGRRPESFPFPFPVPPIPGLPPPPLDCCAPPCDLDPVLEALVKLGERIDKNHQDVKPYGSSIQETALSEAVNNGVWSLPDRAIALRIRSITLDEKMRGEFGGGVAPNVDYAGWYSFGFDSGGQGDRLPISYLNQVVQVPPGARSVSFTMKGATTAIPSVFTRNLRIPPGAGPDPGPGVLGSELLYREPL